MKFLFLGRKHLWNGQSTLLCFDFEYRLLIFESKKFAAVLEQCF